MSTIRYGTSCGPSRAAGTPEVWDKHEGWQYRAINAAPDLSLVDNNGSCWEFFPGKKTGEQDCAGRRSKPVDDADPNVIMQCPYDKNHQIRACRFPFHVVKCAKNHPNLARELKTCPFNAKHIVPKHELAHHIEHCEDKRLITVNEDRDKRDPKFHVPIKWTAPACEEDWEKEADDNAEPFVWGVSNNPLTVNKPEPPVTNNLNAGVRAPRTLPWKSCEF